MPVVGDSGDVVDAVSFELYGLRPEAFTEARDAYVLQARRAGEPAAAKRIASLRKPTLAAWAANLLARADTEQTQRLLELGQALREAHRTLAGPELRELSHQQHVVIAAMAREARRLAGEAGHDISEDVQHEVEQILHAVLADPQTAQVWQQGVLVKAPPEAVGFTALEPGPGTPRTLKQSKATEKEAVAKVSPPPKSARAAEERAARDRERAEAERTAKAVEEATEELNEAEMDLMQTRTGIGALDERITALQEQLTQARQERTQMATAERAATRRHQRAGKELAKAHTAARKANSAHSAMGDRKDLT